MADLVGKNVAISLESSEIEVVVERTIADNDVAGVVSGALTLPRGVQAIVAVGGGVAVDVGKYAGFLTRLPVIAVPTAVSNDGFCSPGASLTVDGRRVSCPATIPFGVVIDTAVVAGSPARFTYSGIGDLLSKFSAIADWKLAYHQTGEPINDFAVMISLQSVQNLVMHAEKSVDDQRFLQLMCGALVMSGVAMEVAGSSRPASGSEHLISHAYDELAPTPSLHGLQVAVATLATTWLQGNPEHDTVLRVLTETGVDGAPGGEPARPGGVRRGGAGGADGQARLPHGAEQPRGPRPALRAPRRRPVLGRLSRLSRIRVSRVRRSTSRRCPRSRSPARRRPSTGSRPCRTRCRGRSGRCARRPTAPAPGRTGTGPSAGSSPASSAGRR